MAYQAKTKVEPLQIAAFLAAVPPLQRQTEARALVALFQKVTGLLPRVFSGGMVGFGHYAYSYASGHSASSMATGFAPGRAGLSGFRGDFGHAWPAPLRQSLSLYPPTGSGGP